MRRPVIQSLSHWVTEDGIFQIYQSCHWQYLSYISVLSQEYLRPISAKPQLYLRHILAISQVYLSHISRVSQTYLRWHLPNITSISHIYLRHTGRLKKTQEFSYPTKWPYLHQFLAIWLKFYIKVDETCMKLLYFISHPSKTLIKIENLPWNFSICVCWVFKNYNTFS